MPASEARVKFQTLPADQQQSLVTAFGNTPEPTKRGILGTAWHYTGGKLFDTLQEISDFTSRVYRTTLFTKEAGGFGQLYNPAKRTQIVQEAWKKANDNGELVYNEERIANATKKYGPARISIVQKVTEGVPLSDIIANGTPEEKEIASLASQNKDPLWQDAYDAVFAAKYSPGRQIANALLPEGLEGSGFLYKGISGIGDAAFRWYTDPVLALGKAKKAYDALHYSIIKIAGSPQKLDAAFQKPQVINMFNRYGAELDNLAKARKAKNPIAMEQSYSNLKRIAPEFGPAAIDEFIKAGVKDADTAKAYMQNGADVIAIFKGQAARQTPLLPRLTTARKIRIAALTQGNKILNIDKVGQKLVRAMYGIGPQTEDIITGITTRPGDIAALEKQVGRFKGPDGSIRFTENQILGRLDRFAAKFTRVPNPTSKVFDVMGPNAVDEIYRTARLANSRYHSKIIAQTFAASDEGTRKQITKGLWNTIFSTRGARKTIETKSFMDEFAGRGLEKRYAPDLVVDGKRVGNPAEFGGEQMALFPYQLSSSMVIPSISELDRFTTRAGLISKLVGVSHQKWADAITTGWSFLTLSGPRFAIRNALEDDMFWLARGNNPWDFVKGRLWSTRIRIGRGVGGDKTAWEKFKDTVFLKTEEGELGVINKFLRADELKEFSVKMADANTEEDVRAILAEAVARRKLAYKLSPEESKTLEDLIKYGNMKDLLADVSEGAKNGARGGGRITNVTEDVNRYGKMEAVRIDGEAYRRTTGDEAFTQFNPVANKQSMVSWLFQIGVATNDDLSRIAIRYLDKPEVAVTEMKKYLSSLSETELKRFELYSKPGGNIDSHAKRAFATTKTLFSKMNGDLNEDLWRKVIKVDKDGYINVSSKNLRLVDLPVDPELAPQFISGPTLVPVADAGNWAASLMERGWDAMGEANARWSREAIVVRQALKFKKELDDSGFTKRVVDQFTANKTDEAYEKAYKNAMRHVTSVAEDLARESSLAYLDNPAVRSQLAMSSRNFARYYRATEDFYRRFYRTVRYNPEAISRAALTYDGIAHSGFVQTDDSGDQYFFYPGTTGMYQALGSVMERFGQDGAIKTPMPIEFSAKLKMITPSSNPDSLFPTFAGPISSISIKAISNIVPGLDKLDRWALGEYGEDQPVINAALPAHLNRLWALFDKNERVSQFASAFRKAATYLEATGHAPKPKIDPQTGMEIPIPLGELDEYKDKLTASTFTSLVLRFVTGFFVPSPPQTTLKSDIATWVRQNGETNFKQTWNNLVEKTGDYDKAMLEWVRLYPNQVPYTVSESESNVAAFVRANKKASEWITKNESLLKKYPQGAAFFIPQEGEFDFDAYKLLMSAGVKQSKLTTDFLRQVSTAYDKNFYYDQKDLLEQELANTPSDYRKRQLKEQWDAWSKAFKGARPLLQEELGKGAQGNVERIQALNDLITMFNDPTVKLDSEVRQPIESMLNVYNQYTSARDSIASNSQAAQNYKDLLKARAKAELERLSKTNRNAQATYLALFSDLMRD